VVVIVVYVRNYMPDGGFAATAHHEVLGSPVGAVFAGPTSSLHGTAYEESMLRALWYNSELRRVLEPELFARGSEDPSAASRSALTRIARERVCFDRAIVFENCHGTVGCRGRFSETERQSFSFSMLTPLTPAKQHLIQLYRNAFACCYFDEETLEAVQSDRRRGSPAVPPFVQQWQRRSVPHVFFDVRTGTRPIRSIGTAAPDLISRLRGIATISFSDARYGSRRWQMQRRPPTCTSACTGQG
jgi:hypothetical protein